MAGLVPAIHVFWRTKERKTWMPGTSSATTRFALLPGHDGGERPGRQYRYRLGALARSPLLAAVDLPAHQRDRFLIDACGIPGLDGGEVRLARLVARARAPAMGFQKVRGRGQRIGGVFEIAGAVGQNGFWHELGLADLAVHRAALAGGECAAIDQLQG